MQIPSTSYVPSADSAVDVDCGGIEFEAETDTSEAAAAIDDFENGPMLHSPSIIPSSGIEGENVNKKYNSFKFIIVDDDPSPHIIFLRDRRAKSDEILVATVALLIPSEVQSTPFDSSPILSSSSTALIATIVTMADDESTTRQETQIVSTSFPWAQ